MTRDVALALFGSVARKESDRVSDRDLLVIADHTMLRERVPNLNNAGWACTAYTWRRLERSIKDGSLFGIHLRNEAIILRDSESRLNDLLHSCTPRPAGYQSEFREACLLISELSRVPSDREGRMWALDVLMVGFRSAAYSSDADR